MNQITEDYVSYKIAQLLKEKGFDIPVRFEYHCIYNANQKPQFHKKSHNFNGVEYSELTSKWYSAPTHQMALKWLREVHNIHIGTKPYNLQHPEQGKWYKTQTRATIYNTKDGSLFGDMLIIEEFCEDTYEEAVEAACLYVLKNLL